MTKSLRLLVCAGLAIGCGESPIHSETTASGDGGVYVFAQRTDPAPASVGPVTLWVDVSRTDGTPASIDTLEVTWLMAAHGHGASGTARPSRAGPGSFRVDGANLTMAGTWQLELKATGSAGSDTVSFAIDVR